MIYRRNSALFAIATFKTPGKLYHPRKLDLIVSVRFVQACFDKKRVDMYRVHKDDRPDTEASSYKN
jgi:hypothetical protein